MIFNWYKTEYDSWSLNQKTPRDTPDGTFTGTLYYEHAQWKCVIRLNSLIDMLGDRESIMTINYSFDRCETVYTAKTQIEKSMRRLMEMGICHV